MFMKPEPSMSEFAKTITEEAALKIRNLNFFYGDFQGLKNVNLDIASTN